MDLNKAQVLMKSAQLDFWYKFGGRKNNGRGFSEQEKLDALKEIASVVYIHRTKSLSRYRKKFNKSYKGMFKMSCFVCGYYCQHRHHIIPLSNGGTNGKLNRVPLCRNCHISIHPWMQEAIEGGEQATHLAKAIGNPVRSHQLIQTHN